MEELKENVFKNMNLSGGELLIISDKNLENIILNIFSNPTVLFNPIKESFGDYLELNAMVSLGRFKDTVIDYSSFKNNFHLKKQVFKIVSGVDNLKILLPINNKELEADFLFLMNDYEIKNYEIIYY